MQAFDDKEFLPASALAKITELRMADPEYPARIARTRKRRSALSSDGRLNSLAADHPARRVTKGGYDTLRMADRQQQTAHRESQSRGIGGSELGNE